MNQRDQALPTALARKLSLHRHLVEDDCERDMRITTDRHQNHPELDEFWDAKEKSARFRN